MQIIAVVKNLDSESKPQATIAFECLQTKKI